jgi:alpha-galactosidase
VFLDSDRLDSDPEAQSRASMLLTNPDINAVARRGKTFRPVEGNTGASAASVFVSNDGTKFYIAAFNWNNTTAATLVVDLARTGLEAGTYSVRDLWTGVKSTAQGTLGITLAKAAATIYELVPG